MNGMPREESVFTDRKDAWKQYARDFGSWLYSAHEVLAELGALVLRKKETHMRMSRWVVREGQTVRFRNMMGSFMGKTHVHLLPTERVAQEFEKALTRTDTAGNLLPLDPETWAGWQEDYR